MIGPYPLFGLKIRTVLILSFGEDELDTHELVAKTIVDKEAFIHTCRLFTFLL